MRIAVELFGLPAGHGPGGRRAFPLEIDAGATASRLIEWLGLPPELRLMVLINGQRVDTGHPLNDGDEVFIFTPAEGG
jgi:molybdopterin converting factor small subunit